MPTKGARFHDRRLSRQKAGSATYLIAWNRGEPVGHLLLKWDGAGEDVGHDHLGDIPELNAIVVKEGLRGQGIGTKLISTAEDLVRSRGNLSVGLAVGIDNEDAHRLYRRLGYRDWRHGTFTTTWTEIGPDGKEREDSEEVVYMTKSIAGLQTACDDVVRKIEGLLETKSPVLVAVDGRSGTGKSTLARAIADRLNAAVVVSDDFYAGGSEADWKARPPEERVEGVVDWRRMRAEALEPLLRGEPAKWHPLDFRPGVGWVGWKEEAVAVDPAPVIVLDGAYSARPELADLVDLSVVVEADEGSRQARLKDREDRSFLDRWHRLWDPAEDLYFGEIRRPSDFDLVVRSP